MRGTHILETAEDKTSQDMEREQLSKGHSLPGDSRGRDKSGHRKKATGQGALTPWRQQREGQVRTWKESNQARGTYKLEIAEGWTSQDMERKQPSEGHSLPGDSRRRDKSGYIKKVTK